MAHITAVFNMKGGVGKSTTAYNLAAGLHSFHKKRVLLIDIDPQGNASTALGIPIWDLQKQLKDVLQRQTSIEDIILTAPCGVDVAPSNILLAEQEIPISAMPGRELLLRKALKPIESKYDFIIIDSPPNIGVFSINALLASQDVLIPVDMGYLALLGLQGIDRAISLIHTELDHPLEILGVLATRYDGRNKLSKEVLEALQKHFGDKVFKTVIPEAVRLKEAPSYSQSIFEYDPNGIAAKAYREFTKEVINVSK
jgi:chromosome partitioning protein